MEGVFVKYLQVQEACSWYDSNDILHICPLLDNDCYCAVENIVVGVWDNSSRSRPKPDWCPIVASVKIEGEIK